MIGSSTVRIFCVLYNHVARAALLGLLAFGAAACAEFEVVASGACGNGVVDAPTEDCDPGGLGNIRCGKPGDSNACRFVCGSEGVGTQPCDVGMTCVQKLNRCVRATTAFGTAVRRTGSINGTNMTLADTDGNGSAETIVTYDKANAGRYIVSLPANRQLESLQIRRFPEWPVPPQRTAPIGGSDAASSMAQSIFAPVASGITMLHHAGSGDAQPDAWFGALDMDGITLHGDIPGDIHGSVRSATLRRTLGRKGQVRDGAAIMTTAGTGLAISTLWSRPDPADVTPCDRGGKFERTIAGKSMVDVRFFGGANVDETTPCDELVVIFADGTFHIFQSCDQDACSIPGVAVTETIGRITPPWAGATIAEANASDIDGAPDVTGDGQPDGTGHADIIAAWAGNPLGSAKQFTVSFGWGAALFSPPQTFSIAVDGQPLPESASGMLVFRERRDLNGVENGRTFGVIQDRIIRLDGDGLGNPLAAIQVTWPTGAPRWDNPIAEDVDRDGVVDVVLTSGPQIYVLRGNGVGSFGTTLIETGSTIRSRTLGDFDGDGLLDLVISHDDYTDADASSTSSSRVSVAIAYGLGAARFGPWMPLISLTNPSAQLITFRTPRFNGSDSIAIIAPGKTAATPPVITLVSDGTQGGLFPSAEVRCSSTDSVFTSEAMMIRAGAVVRRVDGSETHAVVAVAGSAVKAKNSSEGASFDGIAFADLTNAKQFRNLFSCTVPSDQGKIMHLNAADLCGDKSDELIAITVLPGEARIALLQMPPSTDRPAPMTALPTVTPLAFSASGPMPEAKPAQLQTIADDLDGDGNTDLVMRIAGQVFVFWNEATTSSAACNAASFAAQQLVFGPDDGPTINGISVLRQGNGASVKLVALTSGGLASGGLVEFSIGAKHTVSRSADQNIFREINSLGAPTALEIGDVDGDGFPDLVLIDARGLRIHYGLEGPRAAP